MQAYLEGREYTFSAAPALFESWIDLKAKSMESEAMKITPADQLAQIDRFVRNQRKDGNTHLAHMLTSLSHTLAKDDQRAISDLHKFFDYNMR